MGIEPFRGFGWNFTGAKSKCSLCSSITWSLHSLRSSGIMASVRLPRSWKPRPTATNSSSNHPTPMPSVTRPLERRSRVTVERRHLDGVAQRQDVDVGGEPDGAGGVGDVRQRHPHVEERRVGVDRRVARLAVEVRRRDLLGEHEVLGHPHRLEPVGFGGLGDLAVETGAHAEEGQTELHGRPPPGRLSLAVDRDVAVDVVRPADGPTGRFFAERARDTVVSRLQGEST